MIKTTHAVPTLGLLALLCANAISAQDRQWPESWSQLQAPFKIYGNTHYVGMKGLSAVLITSDRGHALIDGGLPTSAPFIAANVRALGFKVEDIKLILNSHVHFDHAGGIAELQRMSGATVTASKSTASTMRQGIVEADDPQYGAIPAIAKVSNVSVANDGDIVKVGALQFTMHSTPGHTPGGTSWTWQSCEGSACVNIVYADSLNSIAAPDFRFTKSHRYPTALADFEKSFKTLSAISCDILIAPHPESVDLFGKLTRREQGDARAFVDRSACITYVDAARVRLAKRIADEGAR